MYEHIKDNLLKTEFVSYCDWFTRQKNSMRYKMSCNLVTWHEWKADTGCLPYKGLEMNYVTTRDKQGIVHMYKKSD